MSNVTIISDGTSLGTKVKVDDAFIKGVAKIEIMPIVPSGMITVKITIDKCAFGMAVKSADIVSNDIKTEEKIREALLDFNAE